MSSIGLAAIVMALYSLPLVERNPLQHQPPSEVTELERGIENQISNRKVQLTIEAQAATYLTALTHIETDRI